MATKQMCKLTIVNGQFVIETPNGETLDVINKLTIITDADCMPYAVIEMPVYIETK